MIELKIIIVILWLLCGVIAYFYFGHKTKWKEYKYSDIKLFDYVIRFVIATIFGVYSLRCVLSMKYNKPKQIKLKQK